MQVTNICKGKKELNISRSENTFTNTRLLLALFMQKTKYVCCILFLLVTFKAVAQKVRGNKLISQQAILRNYDSTIFKAGTALYQQDYDTAKEYYKQASLLEPADTYSLKMIQYIESVQLASAQKQALKQARELEIKRKAEMNSLMDNAMKAIMDKNYDSARALYSAVLNLNPVKAQKEFVLQKIQVLDLALNRSTEKAQDKNQLVASASANVIPEKEVPAAPSAAVAERTNISTSTITVTKDTVVSIVPTLVQPNPEINTIVKIDSSNIPAPLIKKITDTTAISKTEEKHSKKEVDTLMDNALTAIFNKNYEEARIMFNRILISNASKQQKEFATSRIEAIDMEVKKQTSIATQNTALPAQSEKKGLATELPGKKVEPQLIIPPASSNNTEIVAATSKSNTPVASLPQKVLVETSPAEQTRNSFVAGNDESIAGLSSKILNGKGRLDLSDSSNYVKLICQEITVNGKNSFLKFIVQNNSNTDDFIPGSLQLLYIKNYGILQKLAPLYLTDLTTISPKKDLALVYVADAPIAVEPNEVFIFEMADKTKKTKLTINIPGEIYLNKKNN